MCLFLRLAQLYFIYALSYIPSLYAYYLCIAWVPNDFIVEHILQIPDNVQTVKQTTKQEKLRMEEREREKKERMKQTIFFFFLFCFVKW